MSGQNNKKMGNRTHACGGGSSSSKRPGVNSDGKGHHGTKKSKQSDNTTGTGRNTRTHSNVDDAAVVGKIPKALQDFNKTSQKENKEKEGLDKNSMGSTKQRYLSQKSKL